MRSGPGAARTILRLHIISARPSEQPLMVRTFLKVYMELGKQRKTSSSSCCVVIAARANHELMIDYELFGGLSSIMSLNSSQIDYHEID